MALSFKKLFEVKILHHYFLNEGMIHFEAMASDDKLRQLSAYDIHDVFRIRPTTDCLPKLAGHKLIFKKTFTGFLVGTQTEIGDSAKAFADLVEKEQFSFELQIKDSQLFNYSALPIKELPNHIYYFSNRKPDSQYPNLATMAHEFDNGAASAAAVDGDPDTFAYYPGDLLIDDASDFTTLVEAIKSTNNNITTVADWREDIVASVYDVSTQYNLGEVVRYEVAGKSALYQATANTIGNDPTDASSWEKLIDLPLYYVNKADTMRTMGALFTYEFTSTGLDVTFQVKDAYNNVVWSEVVTSSPDKLTHVLNMTGWLQGQYHISITDNAGPTLLEDFDFYLFPKYGHSGMFGVIDIFSGDDLGDFSLVQADNTINGVEYLLRIKNRSTVWRYLSGKDRAVQLETDFNPLTASGNVEVSLSGRELPNPSSHMIKPEAQQYYSEIYL